MGFPIMIDGFVDGIIDLVSGPEWMSNTYKVSTWSTNMVNKAKDTVIFLTNVINFFKELPGRYKLGSKRNKSVTT